MTAKPLDLKHILLGVTGSIAAYKAADLASKLAQLGARVNTLLTTSGTQFVTPLAFQSVTGQEPYTDAALWGAQSHVLRVGMAAQVYLAVFEKVYGEEHANTATARFTLGTILYVCGESRPR